MSELVGLTVVPNEAEAQLVVNRLEMEGIPAMRRTTNAGAPLGPGASGGLGPQEILVHEEDLARAHEIIQE